MTIQGALADLNNLLKADDVPFYYEGSIKKVIETIYMEFEDKELEQKKSVINVLEEVRAEIETLYVGDVCAKEHNCDTDVLEIIDRKIKEISDESTRSKDAI